MKHSRRAMLPALTLTAAALAGGLGAAVATGDGPRDRAAGSAVNEFPTPAGPGFAQLSVDVHSDPSGLHPRGTVHASGTTGAPMGEFEVAGPVTCLRVDGNRAAIKYRFTQASGSAEPFQDGGVEVFVEDNGKSRGGPSVDANASRPPEVAGEFDVNATQCDDPNAASYDTVITGDYTVRDGAAGP